MLSQSHGHDLGCSGTDRYVPVYLVICSGRNPECRSEHVCGVASPTGRSADQPRMALPVPSLCRRPATQGWPGGQRWPKRVRLLLSKPLRPQTGLDRVRLRHRSRTQPFKGAQMSTSTLTRTPAMLTCTLPADCSQDAWESAMDWINSRVAPGAQPIFVDHGDQYVYLFPAAA